MKLMILPILLGLRSIASLSVVATPTDGAALYAQHCATCHEHPQGRIPPRYSLTQLPPEQVIQTLTSGPMRPQASGLDAADIQALAVFLTNKQPSVTGGPDPHANMCATPAGPIDLNGPQWNGWGRDLENTRYQPQPGLTAQDIPRLKLKWAFAYPGSEALGEPIVVGDRLYVTSAVGRVFSLNAKTGCTYWSFDAGATIKTAISVGPVPATSPVRYAAYFGGINAVVYAVDAETGALLWKTQIDDHPVAQIRGSPKLYRDRLYVPVSSTEEFAGNKPNYPCCSFRGALVRLDAATGKMVWKSHSITEPLKPLGKNSAGTQTYGPAGGAIWSSPTIDVKRNRLYVGTGNAYTTANTGETDAVMAFDLDTGRRLWMTQATQHDDFITCHNPGVGNCPAAIGPDFDFGSSTILKTLANGKQILLAGQKAGVLYAFDPDQNGKILWHVKLGVGGALGGIEHGIASDDDKVYVAISDIIPTVAVPAEQLAPHKAGGLSALIVATGERAWYTPAPQPVCSWGAISCSEAQAAAVTTIPGIVFSGSLDGHLRAYAAGDGKVVWDFDTAQSFDAVNGAKASGGEVTGDGQTVANGVVYVNSGGGFYGPAGNALLAFTPDGR